MDNRRKHTKRVFAMLLALIMCLSQAVTAVADEVSDNKAVPGTTGTELADHLKGTAFLPYLLVCRNRKKEDVFTVSHGWPCQRICHGLLSPV